MASTTGDSEKTMHHDAHNSATIAEDVTIAVSYTHLTLPTIYSV